jgi:NTP pyrophosphatase (non-canonical NTP hydrolase)|tara:strand:- start:1193 stop:1474 length:282 start_codon:yes stop_codon:yes gene_type:complete
VPLSCGTLILGESILSKIDPYLLIVAMEEASEFAQACSKVYRHNGGKHERKCLSEEVGDLQAMINLLTEEGFVDLEVVEKKRIKREKKHRRNY